MREGVVALEERHEEEVEGEGGEGDAGSLASPAASAEAADGVADGPGPETVTAPVPDNLPALVEERLHQAASGCYPDAARRFRVKGQVEVGFCVEVGQVGARVELHGTSGSTLLDRAVTQCVVAKAAPFPLPAVGQCFTVLVRFGVE